MTYKPRNILAVVPAQAGTTAMDAEPPTAQPRALMTAPTSSANLPAKGRQQGGPP